jgi:multicomponent Na+:H+ antiporter subunit B
MLIAIEVGLLILVPCVAFVALWLRDLMSAVIVLGAYSFLMCLVWTGMGAVDVAFTEAAVGAGVSTVFFIAVLFNTTRNITFNPLDVSSKLVALVACLGFGYVLLQGVSDLPDWGDPYSPVNAGVSTYYIENAYADTHVPNLVTTVLADYRSVDTMLETTVVLIALLGIFMILKKDRPAQSDSSDTQAHDSLIIRLSARFIAPFIQLFGLYVVAHGHHSPGGGFQGGVILGTGLILMAMSMGMASAKRLLSIPRMIILAAVGVLIYAGWGAVPLVYNGYFLDYSVWESVFGSMARSHSMLIVEIGVALTVMCGMYGIYMSLVSDGGMQEGL